MKSIKDLLKENMTRLLKQRGMTQESLASLLNIETVSVNRYVNKKRFPDAEIMEQIAKHLGVHAYELIKDQNDELTKNDLIIEVISRLPLLETNHIRSILRDINSKVGTTKIKKPIDF